MRKRLLTFVVLILAIGSIFGQSRYSSSNCYFYNYDFSSDSYKFYDALETATTFIVDEKDSVITISTSAAKNIYRIKGKEVTQEENKTLYVVTFSNDSQYIIIFNLKDSLISIINQNCFRSRMIVYDISKYWKE